MVEKGLQVINAWGFSYKTHFVWHKVRHNFGNYSSVRHEYLFLATKGSCTPDSPEKCSSVIMHERSSKHSEKPALLRELIDKLYFPRDPVDRIELFNRGGAPRHWHTFGNESP